MVTRIIIYLAIGVFLPSLIQAQVKIGDNPGTIGSSSLLELESTDKAFVLSKVNDTTAITSPSVGMLVFDESDDCIKMYNANAWSGCLVSETSGPSFGTVSSIDCDGATLSESIVFSGVSIDATLEIPYAGGSGGFYKGKSVSSTGVTGLTLSSQGGGFYNGAGSLTYKLSGAANTTGLASFDISFGGQSCTYQLNVVTDIFDASLSTNQANYDAANDGEWVAITEAEYDLLASITQNVSRVGLAEANIFTGSQQEQGPGSCSLCGFLYTSGYSSNPAPSNSYITAFKITSSEQIVGGDDYVKLSPNNDLSGFSNLGAALPTGIVDGNEQHYVLKGASSVQSSPVYLGIATDNYENVFQSGSGVTGGLNAGNSSILISSPSHFNIQALSTTTIQW